MQDVYNVISSPAWWFTTFVAGVAVNIISHVIIKYVRPSAAWSDAIIILYIVATPVLAIYSVFYTDISPSPAMRDDIPKIVFFFSYGLGPAACAAMPFIGVSDWFAPTTLKLTFAFLYVSLLAFLGYTCLVANPDAWPYIAKFYTLVGAPTVLIATAVASVFFHGIRWLASRVRSLRFARPRSR